MYIFMQRDFVFKIWKRKGRGKVLNNIREHSENFKYDKRNTLGEET